MLYHHLSVINIHLSIINLSPATLYALSLYSSPRLPRCRALPLVIPLLASSP